MSLVIVRPYPYGGGDSLALLTSIRRHSRIGEVTFLHTRPSADNWKFLEGPRLRVVRSREFHLRLGANLIQVMGGVARWLRPGTVVDVAEVGNGYSAQVVRAARAEHVPVVVTVLETRWGRLWDSLPPFSIYTRYVLRHATVFRVLTARSETYLRQLGVAPDRIVRIPVGVDTELFHARGPAGPTGELRVLFARRLEPKNGIELLLRAVRALGVRFPELTLWVAGDGPSRPEVQRAAGSLPVHYVGRVGYPELADVYRSVDVYCNPAMDSSRLGRIVQEDGQYTFPLLESQACGLPVISTISGSNAELLAMNNRLIPQGDPRALEEAIVALTDAPRRAAIARENRNWVEQRFSAASWQPKMDELVEGLGG